MRRSPRWCYGRDQNKRDQDGKASDSQAWTWPCWSLQPGPLQRMPAHTRPLAPTARTGSPRTCTMPPDRCWPSTRGSAHPIRQYAYYNYTNNDLKAFEIDANRNKTTLIYDGFDRLLKIQYPTQPLATRYRARRTTRLLATIPTATTRVGVTATPRPWPTPMTI